MKIGNRDLRVVLLALFQRRHYLAALNMLRIYRHPMDAYRRYLFARGEYPAEIDINAPAGSLTLAVYSPHDILTVNETFCRHDYWANDQDRIIVDFGSNIGISAAYFLSYA